MTNDIPRMDMQKCPDCDGKGSYISKGYSPITDGLRVTCSTCKGQCYIPATEAPVAEELQAARAEIERLKAQLADKQVKFNHFREAVIFAEEQLQGASAEAHERGLIDLEETAYNSYLKVHWLATRGEE